MKIALGRQTKTLLLGAFFMLVPLTTHADTRLYSGILTGTDTRGFAATESDCTANVLPLIPNGSGNYAIRTALTWTPVTQYAIGDLVNVGSGGPFYTPYGVNGGGGGEVGGSAFCANESLTAGRSLNSELYGNLTHTDYYAYVLYTPNQSQYYYAGVYAHYYYDGSTWSAEGAPVVHSSVSALSSPVNQSVSTSTAVTFTFSYTNAGIYSTASVRLDDITAQQSVAMATSSISASGTFTYSQNVTLVDGHYYKATPFIRDTLGKYIYGPSTFFFAVTNNLASFDDLSTTTSTGLFGSAFTLHDTILNKVPFAWIAQIVAIVQANATTSPSGNFPSFNIDIPCAGQTLATFSATNTCQSIALFSISTIKNAHTSSFIETADLLLALFVYFDGLLVLYALRKQLFH